MNKITKLIETLPDKVIKTANEIHRFYSASEDIGESLDADRELHELLTKHIEEFVLSEGIREINEVYNDDLIEVFIVPALNNTFIPSIVTNHLHAPANTVDPSLGVSYEQAMVWGVRHAIIHHILEQGITKPQN